MAALYHGAAPNSEGERLEIAKSFDEQAFKAADMSRRRAEASKLTLVESNCTARKNHCRGPYHERDDQIRTGGLRSDLDVRGTSRRGTVREWRGPEIATLDVFRRCWTRLAIGAEPIRVVVPDTFATSSGGDRVLAEDVSERPLFIDAAKFAAALQAEFTTPRFIA